MSHCRARHFPSRSLATVVMVGVAFLAGAGSAGAQVLNGSSAPEVRQAAPAVDALWAWGGNTATDFANAALNVCQNPTAQASISTCFGTGSQISFPTQPFAGIGGLATDGANVYIGGGWQGAYRPPGYSCPIGGFGTGCTETQIGWGTLPVWDVVAGGGYLWLGGESDVYRCPANLPYTGATSMPAGCVLFDSFGDWNIGSLAYANGTLYVGLVENGYEWSYLYSCPANSVGSCQILNKFNFRNSDVYGLAVGGGYVWAGLNNGQIWRCDPVIASTCNVWDTAGQGIASLADDGQGTLWAAATGKQVFTHPSNVIWSCTEAYANGCTDVISNVFAQQVTAGAGQGFSSVGNNGSAYPPIAYGATQYPQSVVWATGAYDAPGILYVPAGGVTGLGGVQVRLAAPKRALARACTKRDALPASVEVRGAHKVRVVRRLDLCKARWAAQIAVRRYDLLYPGTYSVRVRSSEFSRTTRIVVKKNRTPRVTVSLALVKRS